MAARGIGYGGPARRGSYQCEDCGYVLEVGDLDNMPPCPRSGQEPHELHAWRRQRTGALFALASGLVALGVGALVYAVGTRRVAEEARRLADEGRRLGEEGLRRAESGVTQLRDAARPGSSS